MSCINVDLSPEEEKIFEFRLYQFQGLQIALNQFLNTSEFEYNEEHYNRLTETYIEKYRLFTEYILLLLENREYKNIVVQNFKFEYVKGTLKLYMQ